MTMLRLAAAADLGALRALFRGITARLAADGIGIWNEVYPGCCFLDDIENERLYVLTKRGQLMGAFALCPPPQEPPFPAWTRQKGASLYLERLGVSIECRGKGYGEELLREAAALAKARGAMWLRLLVVTGNLPAVRLYEKTGFTREAGLYTLCLPDGSYLLEAGYYKRLGLHEG